MHFDTTYMFNICISKRDRKQSSQMKYGGCRPVLPSLPSTRKCILDAENSMNENDYSLNMLFVALDEQDCNELVDQEQK